jgi:hypothetical protein
LYGLILDKSGDHVRVIQEILNGVGSLLSSDELSAAQNNISSGDQEIIKKAIEDGCEEYLINAHDLFIKYWRQENMN